MDDVEVDAAGLRTAKFRDRARSTAGLTAAGVGALSAGLVLSPRHELSLLARSLGLASILALSIATALLVVASLIHGRTVDPAKPRRIDRLFLLQKWLYVPHNESPKSDVEGSQLVSSGDSNGTAANSDLTETSDRVLDRIVHATDAGLIAGAVAILCLSAALVLQTYGPAPSQRVTVTFLEAPPKYPGCGQLPETLQGELAPGELTSSKREVALNVDKRYCAESLSDDDVTLVLRRSEINIAASGR